MASTVRVHRDYATTCLNNLLHNCQAEPDAIFIELSCPVQPAKLREKQLLIFSLNANSSVFHFDDQALIRPIVVCSKTDSTFHSEFHGVSD